MISFLYESLSFLQVTHSFLIESYSFLQVTRTAIKAWMGLRFSKIEHGSKELAALGRLKKAPKTYIVSTLVLSFLNGSSSIVQVSRTTIKALMSLIYGHT